MLAEDEKGGKQWRTVFSFQNNKNKQLIIKCLRRGICHLYTKATHFNSYTIHNSRAWHSYGNLIISMSAASILKYFLKKEPLKVETTTRIKVVLDLNVWETDDDRWYHVDDDDDNVCEGKEKTAGRVGKTSKSRTKPPTGSSSQNPPRHASRRVGKIAKHFPQNRRVQN